ncbi:MAG: hypothetical protein AB1345_11755 [Chloroflexota bacterium]
MPGTNKPHIVLVVARGEAVRNFLFSDTLIELCENARITLLSMVDHGEVIDRVSPHVEQIVPLREYGEHPLTVYVRLLAHNAHFRWLWSEAVKFYWGLHDSRAKTLPEKFKRVVAKTFARLFANLPSLHTLTWLDRQLSWHLRPTRDFEILFRKLQPDLVFNCSHIHGPQADLPLRVAQRMGIPTAVFVFSWDNLTSRSRIFVPYDYYLIWNEGMKVQLLEQYPEISPEQVHITGTPQFDFHFKPEYYLPRTELCARLGLDPDRPYVLYTTGMDTDFPDEHKIVEAVIRFLQESDLQPKPQLVVRTYIKGTTPEMKALGERGIPDVVFPPILWDKQWVMPLHEDLYIYTSLLHHCALGINAASTVSLELMMLDKPVINLGFEPPGSNLPHWSRFSRHVDYEHYRPVAQSGGVMVARSVNDLIAMIYRGLTKAGVDSPKRKAFMSQMMNGNLDGQSGRRVAEKLLEFTTL